MKELLEYIVKSIVNNPDSVEITERDSVDFPGLTILTINVAENDIGIVIGKGGRTINAIRDIISINAIRSKKRVRVNLEENRTENVPAAPTEETEMDILDDEI